MRFLSIFTHAPSSAGPTPEMMAAMGALIEAGMKEGWLVGTEGVHGTDEGFRVHAAGGKVAVVDGPFAEAKEVIGGYAIIEAPSRERLIELTRRFLAVAGDGTCEIHQLYVPPK